VMEDDESLRSTDCRLTTSPAEDTIVLLLLLVGGGGVGSGDGDVGSLPSPDSPRDCNKRISRISLFHLSSQLTERL
jgi:hypothetical protein